MAAYRIGHKQLWVDEGVAVGLSHESLGRFLYVITHYEVNQSPFYVVFRAWHVLGNDPAIMRALSAVFSVATIPLVYVVGRRLYDARTGAIAAVVLAFNGLVLQWSQQVRGYTMAMFLVTLATYLFVRTVDEPSTARGFVYGIVAVAAVATHFFSVLVIAAHAVSFLVMRPRPTRVFLVPAALIGGLLLPVALFVATANGDPLAWVDEPGGKVFGRALSRLAGGKFPLLAYCVLGAIGVFVTFRAVRAEPRSPDSFRLLLPCTWVAVPVVLGGVFSVLVTPVFVAKFFIGILPGVALVVVFGIANLRPRTLRVAALLGLVALSLIGTVRWYQAELPRGLDRGHGSRRRASGARRRRRRPPEHRRFGRRVLRASRARLRSHGRGPRLRRAGRRRRPVGAEGAGDERLAPREALPGMAGPVLRARRHAVVQGDRRQPVRASQRLRGRAVAFPRCESGPRN